MTTSYTKRRRNVVITALVGIVLLGSVISYFWYRSAQRDKYIPGEDIEGISEDLDRDLPDDYPRVTFEDVSGQAGINFHHFYKSRSSQLPEDMGSGAAWGDYDNDGWQDLFIVNESGSLTLTKDEKDNSLATCKLYHNNKDGTFTDVTVTAGLVLRIMGNAAAWADIDNDGYIDLWITSYGKNYLFKNNGDGSFKDISTEAGIADLQGFWTGASWGDFNKDGLPDIYICGYVKYSPLNDQGFSKQFDVDVPSNINPSAFPAQPNLLYLNNGDDTFAEIGRQAGVDNPTGKSLSATWCDFNGDTWPDLYVANDVSDNMLFLNTGHNSFNEISHPALVADYRGAMGLAVGDWDNDQDQDIFITHWIAQENALYSNMKTQLAHGRMASGELKFMDEADRYGLGQIALDYIGFGTSFIDYDNDGNLDIYIANGSTFQMKENPQKLIPMHDQLFWNKGRQQGFFDVTSVSGPAFDSAYVGRGFAAADYDNDGDLDLFVVNNGGPGQLLRNSGVSSNHWLEFKLVGKKSNSHGLGSQLVLSSANQTQTIQAGSQASYLSQNSSIIHFGLGIQSVADALTITWPSGEVQAFKQIPVNHMYEISESRPNLKKLW